MSETGLPPEGDAGAGLTLEVTPEQDHKDGLARATRAILGHPMLRQHFPAGDLWLVGFDPVDKPEEGPRFTSTVHDTLTGRSVRVDGWLDDFESLALDPTSHQRPPSEDEHAWALSVLADDSEAGALLARDGAFAYRPLPPLANIEHPDGTVDRVITLGVRTGGAEGTHHLFGVRASDGEILREPAGSPGTT